MFLFSLSTWDFFGEKVETTKIFLLLDFCCWTPPSCLKVKGWWVGGLQHFSVSPRPLGSFCQAQVQVQVPGQVQVRSQVRLQVRSNRSKD